MSERVMTLRLCYGYDRTTDDRNVPRGEYDAPVTFDPTLRKRGECNIIRIPGHAETWIVLREWDEQVLLHEVLHALVGEVVPSEGVPGDLNHRIVATVEVGLTLAGWRLSRAVADRERLAGVTFRIGVACDGYAGLQLSDVPEDIFDEDSYIEGSRAAAEAIRAALAAPHELEGT